MYILKTNVSFDAAHFLANYEGKCRHIHGHRWVVEIEVESERVQSGGHLDGMVVDFQVLKDDLKAVTEEFDHGLIIQEGSMRKETISCLKEEGFQLIVLPFRPTAENLSKHIYGLMGEKGYRVRQAAVYETPNNCAIYCKENKERNSNV